MRYLKGILLPALLLATAPFAAAAKKDQPDIAERVFASEVANILYFDDSDVVLLAEVESEHVYRSEDAGKTWEKQDGLSTIGIIRNPFDNQVAVVLGERKHWITYNQGKDWDSFETSRPPSPNGPLSFHAQDSKKIIFNEWEGCSFCVGKSFYTTDGFKSKPKLLRENRKMCMWARSSERFLMDSDDHKDRVLCITTGKYSNRFKDFRLMRSDNFFEDENEVVMSTGRTVAGMSNMAAIKGYFVAAAKSDHSNELALYVTGDTDTWHRALFGNGRIEEDAYTILESTNYSIQVDVMTSKSQYIGELYTSNSNGTYFTKNVESTNRNAQGNVDFEKVSSIQGVVLVNVVANSDVAELQGKKIQSKISFDDGRTFEDLKVGDDILHVHSVTDLHNSGRVFSSPAPGIVMAVGNTGKYLDKYNNGDLYVSDDAGLTWQLALKEAHKYEFGDQGNVLVAVYDEGEVDKVMYSLHHGRPDTWKELKLGFKIRVRELTTVPDSTSLKFILDGLRVKDNGKREWVAVQLDFNGLQERTCGGDDFEDFFARKDDKKEASCVMGHKQIFRRRKPDADCFVKKDFEEPAPKFEPCPCDEVRDYECDFNFVPEGEGKDKKCVPSKAMKLPEGACKKGDKTYKGSSGWRKIPGNECKGTTEKDKEKEWDCGDVKKPTPTGITSTMFKDFKAQKFEEYYYLEHGDKSQDTDETVVALTDQRTAWITHDHGKTWAKAVDDEIVAIYPHQYNNDYVYFLTTTPKVYYSTRRGEKKSIHSFNAPFMPNVERFQILQFHPGPNQTEWLIWIGGEHCEKNGDPECHTVASVSEKNGQKWEPLLPYVKKCAFIWREQGRVVDEKLVFCEQYTNEEMGAPVELISSSDWFVTKDVKFKSVVEFATMSEFIIVATKDEDGKSLKLDASLDGATFADAKFPPKFHVDHQTAYTVLDSSTHSVFLHVTVNPRRDEEYGSIIKSNSNGTWYVLSLEAVNRDTRGYVDFEKMQGIEGVALANVVANKGDVDGGAKKQLKTMITHNDGADWETLQAPNVDSDNKPYSCDVRDKTKCSLHIHGYTERRDPRETYSSPTAVGIMMGIGNVGDQLGLSSEANTFITTDAGITWKEVKKGNYAWEYGDQGSVIVIVKRGKDVKHLYYSLNSGDSWEEYEFADHAITVEAITTIPSDTSLNFLVWGTTDGKAVTVNVDFSNGLFDRQCELDDNNPLDGDYVFWSPQHPLSKGLDDNRCLFGHVAQYHRKKDDAQCFNGRKIDHLHSITKNCSCTRRDFECDYNYQRMPGGECQLVEGLTPADPKEVCKQKGVTEYWEITGYRKIPISTCHEGQEMEHTSKVNPCPGFEEEFQRKHGISGFGLFLAIVVPFVAAGGIGYYIWRNWDGKFGRIRLGEGPSQFNSDSPWISWPVAAVSAVVAVVAAVPLLIGSLWRMVSSRFGGYGGRTYTSRSSFARGRGDYAVVDPDEGELLGEDSDEEV